MGTLLLLLLNDAGTPLAPGQIPVTVGNDGDADIAVGTVALTGDSAAFTISSDAVSGTVLAPGEARRIVIDAVTGTAGTYLATLRIPSSDPDGSLTVALLSVVAAALVKAISVDPLTWDYGGTDTATGTAVKVFTVSATGTAPIICGTVAIGGAGAASYAKSADGVSGVTIPAGESRSVTVTFDPATDGAKAGTLTFPSDAGASIVVPLAGTGTTGAPAPTPTLVTRFYLSRQVSADYAIIDDAGWDAASPYELDHVLAAARGGPAVAWGTSVTHTGAAGDTLRLVRWFSDPLAAQAFDGAIRCYAIGYRASALGTKVTSAIRVGLWRGSAAIWQPVRAMGSAVSPWALSSGPLPRSFPAGADWTWPLALDIQAGDRLILELGARVFTAADGAVRVRWGGESTATDLDAAETVQDAARAPWIEFQTGLLVLP